MPVFDKRKRSRESWKRRLKFLVAGLFLLAVIGGGVMVARRAYRSVYISPEKLAPPPLHFRAARPVFPYSVIPGGIYDSEELAATMRVDSVAREHYSDVRLDHLVPVRLQAPLQAYVSYRVGDKVFWTGRKINIPRGELVLTDGVNMIRARCGNRIVNKRQTKISTMVSEEILESVIGTPAGYASSKDAPEKPDSDITVAPEPGSLVLCLSGLSVLLAAAGCRRRWGAR